MKIWPAFLASTCLLVLFSQSGCMALSKMKGGGGSKAEEKDEKVKEKQGGENKGEEVSAPVDVSFLLSMSFNEAKTLSAQTIEFPPFYKVAADSIEVTKTNKDGTPRRVRAKGRVFIEMSFLEPAKGLCQELLLSDDEVILRGKPVVQRGGSTLEGMDDYTVFYMFGTKLRVIGAHCLSYPGQVATGLDASGLPTLGAWTDSPNPLLPPLTESDVPAQVRAELQRAAEAELMHQQTRAQFGPAAPEPKSKNKKDDKKKPEPKEAAKKEEKPSDQKKAKS
jgi:hypothetical protein